VFVRSRGGSCLATVLILVAGIVTGCGTGLTPGGEGRRTTLSLSTLGLDSEDTHFESQPNDSFETAEQATLSTASRAIRGSISNENDVDVYDLGPMQPGDRVLVEMTAVDSLDGALALFDERGASLLVNDHRNVYLGRREPFVDVVLRRGQSACFVAVSSTPGFNSMGDYGLLAWKQPRSEEPLPRPDAVVLDFDGGSNVRVGSRGPLEVPRFDASAIDARYAGRTAEMIAVIVDQVRSDYLGYDLAIYSTGEGDGPPESASRIYFGTFDAALLGVAEGVDEFNATTAQRAIVFTDTFEAFLKLDPSVEEMGQAIANVASHEIGHLLGLVHTADREGIMDVTASLNDLLLDQSFRRSPLYSAVFPLGDQDAIQMLLDTLGGDPFLAIFKLVDDATRSRALTLPPTGPPARNGLTLSTCGLDEP